MSAHANVAVIGAGRWGKNLVRVFSEIDRLGLVCDHDPAVIDTLANTLPERVKTTARVEHALTSDVAAVAIATPPQSHYELARNALVAGKHVFVEKPMARTVAEAEQLRDIAAQRNLVLMVGHVIQHHPALAVIEQLLVDGAIGELQRIDAARLEPYLPPGDGSALSSIAGHAVALVLRLFGEPPRRVLAEGREDAATIFCHFSSARSARVLVNERSATHLRSLTLYGTTGRLVFDELNLPTLTVIHKNGCREPIPVSGQEPLVNERDAFLSAIDLGVRPHGHADDGVAVVRVVAEARHCLRLRESG